MDGRGQFGALLAGAGLSALAAAPAQAEVQAYRFHASHVLGTSLDLLAVAPDRATALVAAQAARDEIDRLDAVLSGWRADSELSALNAAGTMRVSADLYRVLAACERWRETTAGAFDGRLGAVLALWREGEAAGAVPDAATLQAVAAQIGAAEVGLDPVGRMVTRPQAVRFAPEALAKGYVVDAALAAARASAPGLAGMMVDIGGDLRCWGAGPGDDGWTIGVADAGEDADNLSPALVLRADGRAVAASGPGPRDFLIGAAAYPHLMGGRSNRATVSAASAADADALATALAVMAPGDGIALADRLQGVEARVVDEAGRPHTSAGWAALTYDGRPSLLRVAGAVLRHRRLRPAGAHRDEGLFALCRHLGHRRRQQTGAGPDHAGGPAGLCRRELHLVAALRPGPPADRGGGEQADPAGRALCGGVGRPGRRRPAGRPGPLRPACRGGARGRRPRLSVHPPRPGDDAGAGRRRGRGRTGAAHGPIRPAPMTRPSAGPPPRARPRNKRGQGRPRAGAGDFYRLCRMLHGYLSAFAFLALIFFSITGLTLNHPDWLAGRPPERTRIVQVPKSELDLALTAADPGEALAAAVGRLTPLVGAYASGEVLDGEALLRLEGPPGRSDITLDTATGRAEVATQAAGAVALLNDLHKGKAAGGPWKLLIDASAVLFIVLSVLGYVLFFSLRFRLKLSLILTAASLALLLGAFWLFVA